MTISGSDNADAGTGIAKKKCFVLSPIGKEDSEERARADFVFEYIIEPVLDESDYEFDCDRADKDPRPGIITDHIILAIKDADLIIADLTGHNPNVFYELGFAHTLKKPVVHLIENPDRPPFDQAAFRSVFFHRNTVKGYADAKALLAAQVAAVMRPDFVPSNPISVALGIENIAATGDDRDRILADLANRFTNLEARLDRQELISEAGIKSLRNMTYHTRTASLEELLANDPAQSSRDFLGSLLVKSLSSPHNESTSPSNVNWKQELNKIEEEAKLQAIKSLTDIKPDFDQTESSNSTSKKKKT